VTNPAGQVSGRVVDDLHIAGVTIEIDHTGNGSVDHSTTTDFFGRFSHVPLGLESGPHTIYLRTRQHDHNENEDLVGAWVSQPIEVLEFTPPTPVLSEYGLVHEGDPEVDDPTVSGLAEVIEGLTGYVIQFDHNDDGQVDGLAIPAADGQFEYTPFDLEPGQVTLAARVKAHDAQHTARFSSWQTINFTLSEAAVDMPHLVALGLTNPGE
jgi:hypothetical protein